MQSHYMPEEAIVQCKLLKSGINDTYLVRCANSKYVLRIYALNWRTPLAISEELKVVKQLHGAGLPVSYAVAATDGGYITPIEAPEGERYCVLYSYAEGRKLQQYDAALHEYIGGLVGQMHLQLAGMELNRPDYNADTLLHQPMQQIADFVPEDSDDMRKMQLMKDYLTEVLAGADASQIRSGIVHLDVWFDNMSITDDGRVTLFDFDFCGNGWLCLDVAYYVLQLHYTERDEAVCASKVAAFLAGYEAVVVLSAEERRLLPALGVCLYFFYLGTQCSRFENWSNSFMNEAYMSGFINRIIKPYYDKWVQPALK